MTQTARQKFIEQLRNNQHQLGTMLTLPSPEVAEMLSKCGFDWFFMDGEHSALSTLDWQRMIQAVGGRCANIIRVHENSESAIKKLLDIGADGIIAPKINTAEEAVAIVSWCKYPPSGERGVGLARAQGYGLDFADYMETANDQIAVILQAEHIDAVNNIDNIVEVPGIDCIFIGPYDLSASMGKMGQVDNPDVVAAIAKVKEACDRKNIAVGYFGVNVASVQPYIEAGYSLICAGVDAGLLTQSALELRDSLSA
jgi:2-dehydro-3-deoxyglucarate aldolase